MQKRKFRKPEDYNSFFKDYIKMIRQSSQMKGNKGYNTVLWIIKVKHMLVLLLCFVYIPRVGAYHASYLK